MANVLIVSNCQAAPLARCMNFRNAEVQCTGVTIEEFREDSNTVLGKSKFNVVLYSNELFVAALTEAGLSRSILKPFPAITFTSYHPDICYVTGPSGRIFGPMGDYQSLAILCGYKKGLVEPEIRDLFRKEIFASAGYLSRWESETVRLTSVFRNCGVDLSKYLPRWSRRGAFMHTINHPLIDCIFDLAGEALLALGLSAAPERLTISDSFTDLPRWPVYPEIGEELGLPGHYQFLPGRASRSVSLEALIKKSLAAYSAHDPGLLRVLPQFDVAFDKVMSAI